MIWRIFKVSLAAVIVTHLGAPQRATEVVACAVFVLLTIHHESKSERNRWT